ncbi:MAG: DegT/DnrJ/EryC1/StrS family aminotransferase [Acetobacteraceae bacterium]|nr:DegT/DnrJ/EryC1/StrS family aminotransferase [Acetobacteraceae bacterium]MBV8588842.1 DegT/DnrJ/EryC1/StrS family aminotransferase [Acetobacteraceae bacterium]
MIPFLDLAAQHRSLIDELSSVVTRVLQSGHFVLGENVRDFEAAFARYCGAEHAVSVNTGTSALHLALLAVGVEPGDEVITTPMTFVATVAAIMYAGAVPKLVDIEPETWTIDPDQLEGAITSRTRAIIPVHLHGRLADMERILWIARARGIPVIEDAAQAHGAEREGRRAGTFGDIGCFSFYPGKNLGACGEGGAIVTDQADLADRVRMLRDWGQERKYLHVARGFNYRLDEIQAAILSVKLRYIEDWTRARQRAAARYDALLAGSGIPVPAAGTGQDHVYHVYGVRVRDRDWVRNALAEQGIQTGVHYPIPVHLQPAYAGLGYGRGAFPVTERLAQETLSLPMFPEISEAQIGQVCDALIRIAAPVAA